MDKEQFSNYLVDIYISRKDKILLILFYNQKSIKKISDIKEIGLELGLTDIKKWNISSILATSLKGYVIKIKAGWKLSLKGENQINQNILKPGPIKKVNKSISSFLTNIKKEQTRLFIKEAISAMESGLIRSSVVLSWIGAIDILYEYTSNTKLKEFNTEAIRRNPKWKPAKKAEDFSLMKEYDFLQIICSISIIDKNVKQELEGCLKLRNSCGHPNSLRLGENRVATHIETLILNIYSVF